LGYSITTPISSTEARQTPTIYQGNWDAIEDFLGTEHYSLNSSLSGCHMLGIVGVMAENTTSGVSALSTAPGSGALAFDTTVGAWVYNGEGDDEKWKTIHRWLPTTRVQARLSSNFSPTSGTQQIVPFATEDLDSLSEYSTTTYVFCAQDAGYFMVNGTLLCKTSTSTGGDTLTLTLCGSYASYRVVSKTTPSSAYESLSISTIAYVPSAGTLAFYLTAPSSVTTTVSAAAGCTFMRIHRVS